MEVKFIPETFFDLSSFGHREIFSGCQSVWDAIPKIEQYILRLFKEGKVKSNCGEDVFLGEGTVVEPGAYIEGPAIIGKNCRIGHVALLRGNILTGDNCVFGHATEVKNSLFLSGTVVAHLNYVGDSILGNNVNLAAGAILANFRLDGKPVVVKIDNKIHDTKLVKFGAIIGDSSKIGANSVLNPGTVLGKNCLVYPSVSAKGYHPSGSVIK
ncbi:MAG: DapH/DapD/GlmU-related protein [bacterium]|nr:DapH/DapD/GlmU-related protein [bacterium]